MTPQFTKVSHAVVPIGILVTATALGLRSVHGTGDGAISAWGLIAQLPPGYWICLLVPLATFSWQFFGQRTASVLAASLVAQVILLHGVAAAAETMPRFATAWLHAGFTNQILVTGHTAPNIDARFSWPGFFSGAAVFSSAVGVEPIALIRWAPVFFVLSYLPPLALLTYSLCRSTVVVWATLWIFVLADWVGQDYFAPQSFAYLLFLTVLSISCCVFVGRRRVDYAAQPSFGPSRAWALLRRRSIPQFDAYHAMGDAKRAALLLLVVGLSAALSMSHQLTPFMLTSVLESLVLASALRARLLPIITLLLTAAWISFGAFHFWVGHLHMIFGGAGNVQSAVGAGVGSRLAGSAIHRFVLDTRIGFTLLVWGIAAFAALSAFRGRRLVLPAIAMAAAPFAMLTVQSYGGEGVLRVYLFTLPAMSILLADLLVHAATSSRARMAIITLFLIAAMPLFIVTRYGNESFERIKPGELRTVNALYAAAPLGSTLVSITPNVPWRYQGLSGYIYQPATLDEFALNRVDTIVALMSRNERGAYLIITQGQTTYAEQSYGLPPNWRQTLEDAIESSGRFQTVYRSQDGVVYRLLPNGEARN